MEFIDILIYMLASLGLIFTMVSIIESYNNYIPYYIQNFKRNEFNEITIKIRDFKYRDIDELIEIIEIIENGDFNNIYEIAEEVKIIK